ncbi:MAG: hypothetical protein ACRC0V_00265 [Fusobacteriaceae bacterium]
MKNYLVIECALCTQVKKYYYSTKAAAKNHFNNSNVFCEVQSVKTGKVFYTTAWEV